MITIIPIIFCVFILSLNKNEDHIIDQNKVNPLFAYAIDKSIFLRVNCQIIAYIPKVMNINITQVINEKEKNPFSFITDELILEKTLTIEYIKTANCNKIKVLILFTFIF